MDFFVLAIYIALCLAAWSVGRQKGRPMVGLILGAIFGVFGILVVALIPKTPEKRARDEFKYQRALSAMEQ